MILGCLVFMFMYAQMKLDIYKVFELVNKSRLQKEELHDLLDEMYEAVIMIKQGKIQFSNRIFLKLKYMFETNIQELTSSSDNF